MAGPELFRWDRKTGQMVLCEAPLGLILPTAESERESVLQLENAHRRIDESRRLLGLDFADPLRPRP